MNNVFVLCTGRCGSMTISKAFSHATNYTAGHETEACSFYPLAYPDNHIEVDNRLAWMLGDLDYKFPDAKYVHLLRNQDEVARSFAGRADFPGASVRGFGGGILGLGDGFAEQRYEVAKRMWEVKNANISEFIRHHLFYQLSVWLHELTDELPRIWEWLGCEGDLDAAVAETRVRYNAGPSGVAVPL